jgi:hypothetical protein
MKRGACLALAVLLAVGVAGCGGGGGRLSRRQYEQKMTSVVQEARSVQARLGSFQPTDFGAVDEYFQRLADGFTTLHDRLTRISPPKDVDALHERLVTASGGAAKALNRLARRLRRATPAERQRILTSYDASTQQLLSALNAVEDATNAFAAKGYRFRTSAGT